MKTQLYQAALLAALGLASVSAQADGTFNNGDLLVGFVGNGHDYVVDLGQNLTPGTTLNAINWNTFSTTFGSSDVAVGVVGANAGGTGNNTIYESALRTGVDSTLYGTAGTEAAPGNLTRTKIDDIVGNPGAMTYGVTVNGGLGSSGTTWGDMVSTGAGAGQGGDGTFAFNGTTTFNPMTDLGLANNTLDQLNLDIYSATDVNHGSSANNAFGYVGDIEITVDNVGDTVTAVWDPVAVPEPATFGLLAGFGVLALGLRNQFSRKNA